ncbi:helix-turn-helix domain-containing protein [Bacteroides salyersiae]|uniref:helix-turn-helix domain-containing protein n=1 Tax=Bacteroides salyersiae TaxID=291644 RepID=UPI003DA4EBA9
MENLKFVENMKYMIREAIIERIKDLRITQKQLAEELGLTYQNLNGFLTGRRTLPVSDIERMLHYLKLVLKVDENLR